MADGISKMVHGPYAISPQPSAMTRAAVVVAAAALISCGGSPPIAGLRAIKGQNVLLVTIDTLRADALGAYGGPAATPAIDRLAAHGVRFDFAHAQDRKSVV